MLLRSSSTPVLGSLLPPFSDTPNNNIKSPYHQISCLNLSTTTVNSCTSSPSISESSDHFSRKGGVIRRAQSESNLEGLDEDCQLSSQPKKISFSGRQKCLILETIPSFSCYNLKNRIGEEDCDEGDDGEDDDGSEFYMEEEERVQMVANSGLSLMERNWEVEFEEQNGFINEEMYLARGLGIDGGGGGGGGGGGRVGGGGGGGGFRWAGGDGGGERQDTEEYYKKMVQENPGNSLFLRNYAQFLYQTKGDLHGAEEYYSRAILTDPEDGEILSQYAKLVWELHHDLDRASSYFERAVRASPADSHVHAAYASFLWETEEDEDECNAARDFDTMSPHFHGGVMASTHA